MVDGRSEGRGDAGVAGDERPFPRLAGRPPLSIPFSAVLSFLKKCDPRFFTVPKFIA